MQVTVKFNAAPPPGGHTFGNLLVTLTDAGNGTHTVQLTPAQVQAAAVLQGDGSYTLPVTFSGVAVGGYTVSAQACDAQSGAPMGAAVTGSGVATLADSGVVWYPQPTGFA